MICEFCRYGADLRTAYKSGQAPLVIDPQYAGGAIQKLTEEEVYSIIRRSHERCRGKSWCDCQHSERERVLSDECDNQQL